MMEHRLIFGTLRTALLSITFLGALSVSGPVFAQASDFQILLDRMERLERDIRTLNRQVARGDSAAQAVAVESGQATTAVTPAPQIEFTEGEGALARVTVRLGELEHEVRQTTGLVEDMSYQLNQLNQRVDSLITGMNYRLGRLEGVPQSNLPGGVNSAMGGAMQPLVPDISAAPTSPGVTTVGSMAPPTATSLPEGQQGTVTKDGTYVPPKSGNPTLGSVSKTTLEQYVEKGQAAEGGAAATSDPTVTPAQAQTAMVPAPMTTAPGQPTSAAMTPTPAPAPSVLPVGTPKERYQFAFGLMRQARYDDAEVALKAFIDEHGSDPLASNARYWLGETYYVRKSFMEAAQTFFQAYQDASDGPKAPDSLLKLGMSMGNLDKNEEACATFSKLRKEFKDLKSSVKKTLDREVKRLKCQ
ncbi:MAG: tol-pal system protein YbgF [Magnetovibrio sp.]|nr:tol-pal system protein YbgF [Magnetovibrio sp.]